VNAEVVDSRVLDVVLPASLIVDMARKCPL
jgi:hypothetical protein